MTLTAGRRSDHDTRVRVDAAGPPASRHDGMRSRRSAFTFAAPRPTVLATTDRGERYVAHAESTLVCAAFLAAGADLNGKGRRVGSNAKETTNV